jgi:hypothetical protein
MRCLDLLACERGIRLLQVQFLRSSRGRVWAEHPVVAITVAGNISLISYSISFVCFLVTCEGL